MKVFFFLVLGVTMLLLLVFNLMFIHSFLMQYLEHTYTTKLFIIHL